MKNPHGNPSSALGDNPFPFNPTADGLEISSPFDTTETRAVILATEALNSYLTDPAYAAPESERIATLAVSGEYGTGKTHLVNHLLALCAQAETTPARYRLLSAQPGSFQNLYFDNFLKKVNKSVVLRRLREYYGQTVAASLGDDRSLDEVKERLCNNKIDPLRFVREFGLPETTYLEEMRAEITAVTQNEEFSTALTLMLRGDLTEEVWQWLTGKGPDQLLKERNITSTISDDLGALQALGMFFRLFRGRDRFVLVIDEMEKVLSKEQAPTEEALNGFRELVRVTARSGIFLVLAGLPEFVDFMGGNSTDARMHVVRAAGFSQQEVESYVTRRIERIGREGMGPFSSSVLEDIRVLTGGNIRQIIQICRDCYRLTIDGGEVTRATVHEVTKDRFELIQTSKLRVLVAEELTDLALPFRTNHRLTQDGSTADFWIPVGEDAGCAIFLTDSVLKNKEARDLANRARSLIAASPRSRTLLIVNGYVSDKATATLREAFPSRWLRYVVDGFSATFSNAVNLHVQQIEATELDPAAQVRTHVERLTTMHIGTQRYVDLLARQVKELRQSAETGFATLGQRITEGHTGPAAGVLPETVENSFAKTLDDLYRLTDVKPVLATAFDPDSEDDPVRTLLLRDRAALLEPLGMVRLAETLIRAFQDGIIAWYEGSGPAQGRLAALRGLCRTFESLSEYLPYQVLDEIGGLRERFAARGEPESLPAKIRELVGGLGIEVEKGAAASLGPSR